MYTGAVYPARNILCTKVLIAVVLHTQTTSVSVVLCPMTDAPVCFGSNETTVYSTMVAALLIEVTSTPTTHSGASSKTMQSWVIRSPDTFEPSRRGSPKLTTWPSGAAVFVFFHLVNCFPSLCLSPRGYYVHSTYFYSTTLYYNYRVQQSFGSSNEGYYFAGLPSWL